MRIEEVLAGAGEAITLQEFIHVAGERFDPYDVESVWSMREPLARLANNREWIFATMAARLRERMNSPWAREQPSYFVLHLAETFALRANIWLPERRDSGAAVLENAAFSYDYPHDHNFDILTATCFGPGYDTEIYEYDAIADDATVGTMVYVESLGRRRLSPGTVFLYEACYDVHTQLPVEDVTVTLNFLPFRKENHARPQFIFEHMAHDTLRVVGMPLSPEGREMSAVRMMAKLAGAGFGGVSGLRAIAAKAANGRVADYAGAKLLALDGSKSTLHDVLLAEIDKANVAFKYHEVAELSRSKAA